MSSLYSHANGGEEMKKLPKIDQSAAIKKEQPKKDSDVKTEKVKEAEAKSGKNSM